MLDSVARRFARAPPKRGGRSRSRRRRGRGRPARLEQAIGNFVENALRYGAPPIRLDAAEATGRDPRHRRGPGFPPEFLERAFERFSRAPRGAGDGGAGLGLAIAAAVARAHGGEATARNLHGGGAEVTISIPVASSHEPIDPRVDIGHVHLKVADIERALALLRRRARLRAAAADGRPAAFISAGGYHHHIGLNTWESRGGTPPPPRHDRASTTSRSATRPRDARRRAAPPRRGRRAARPAPATTASAKPSTCATRTGTASSSPGTGRARSGRATPDGASRW